MTPEEIKNVHVLYNKVHELIEECEDSVNNWGIEPSYDYWVLINSIEELTAIDV